MKVLVLTCSTGGGHNSCANYIKMEFDDFGVLCDVKDYMDIVGSHASKIAEKLYLDSTKGNGKIFKNIYKLGELYDKTSIPSPVYGLNKLVKDKLYKYILDNDYDIVIVTHVFPSLAMTALKKEKNIPLINVATDYECIPFWDETKPDVFVIPSEMLKTRFVQKGIKEDVIISTGIPVASRFFKNMDKLDLKHDKPIVLITSGSMGFGKMEDVVRKILDNSDCYVIVVCGNNKDAYQSLSKLDDDRLMVLGFINNLNAYIKESDIVVAKPGGLTTTEVVMMRKPLVHMMPIPGVENYNANFFSDLNMSIKATNLDEVINGVLKILNNKGLMQEMINNQKKYINDKSAKDMVEYIISKYGEEEKYE